MLSSKAAHAQWPLRRREFTVFNHRVVAGVKRRRGSWAPRRVKKGCVGSGGLIGDNADERARPPRAGKRPQVVYRGGEKGPQGSGTKA
eukprot:415718-Prymnesium_polylepis.1